MTRELGEIVEAGADVYGFGDDGTATAGEAVAISGGQTTPADSDAGHVLAGVRTDGMASGSSAPIAFAGALVAKVASGVSEGVEVDIGNTTNGTVGDLVATSGGSALTLSDEGGSYKGTSLPAGAAVVYIRG